MAKYKEIAIRLSLENTDRVKETLRTLGDDGAKALRQIERAATPPSKALVALNTALSPIKGALAELSAQAGPAGRALQSFGGYGAMAAVGAGTMMAAFMKGTKVLLDAEKAHKRLQVVLDATGNVSGLTANQIEAFSNKFSKATGIQNEALNSAAATLATYRDISGDVFIETIKQAANLSAMYGGDLDSNVQSLGKTMERLATGEAVGLKRAFQGLSSTQEEYIKKLVESGQILEAQRALLKAIEKSVGGTAEKLSSASSRLSVAWEDLLKNFGNTGPIKEAVRLLQQALDVTNEILRDKTTDEKITELMMARNVALNYNSRWLPAYLRPAADRNREIEIANINKQIDALEKLKQKEVDEAKAAQAAADQQRRETEVSIEVNKEIKHNEKLLQEQTDAHNRSVESRTRAIEQIDNQVRALKLERENLSLSDRERFISTELIKAENEARKANMTISSERKSKLLEEAAALYDASVAEKNRIEMMEKGAKVIEGVMPADERRKKQLDDLNTLLRGGAIDQRSFNRASLQYLTDPKSGAKRAFDKYLESAEDASKAVEKLFTNAMNNTDDALTQMLTSAGTKFDKFGDLLEGIANDIAKMFVQKNITGPIYSGLSSSLGGGGIMESILSFIFHDGGVVGKFAQTRPVPASLFTGAPRFHSGLASDEVPAILQKGEAVLPKGVGISTNMQVNVINNAGVEVSTKRRYANGTDSLEIMLDRAVTKKLSQRGSGVNRALRGTYGASERLVQR